MRSYGQYCALARALDVIGERWSLLIVRELLDGPRRYAELLEGLPGIATNLLVDRLRSLENGGVVQHEADGRYRLSDWGSQLREPIYALGRWAAPTMARTSDEEASRSYWLAHMVVAELTNSDARPDDVIVEIRSRDEPATIFTAEGKAHVVRGPATRPDVVLDGPPEGVAGILFGMFDAAAARDFGVDIVGEPARLRDLRPDSMQRREVGTSPKE